MKYPILLTSALVTGSLAANSTVTATQVFTIPCTASPLPNDCLENSWSNTVVQLTITPGDVLNVPTDIAISSADSTRDGNFLSGLPSLTGQVPDTTMVTATTVFTIACTASPLPEDCKANDWSNTVVQITATPGQVLQNLPTELLVSGTTSASATASESTGSAAPKETPGAAVGMEVGVLGAVVGGLVAGLAVL